MAIFGINKSLYPHYGMIYKHISQQNFVASENAELMPTTQLRDKKIQTCESVTSLLHSSPLTTASAASITQSVSKDAD